MADYKCTQCGLTAYSKCTFLRNTFPNGDIGMKEAFLGHALKQSVTRNDDGSMTALAQVTVKKGTSPFKALQMLVNVIREQDEEVIKTWCCPHNWELQSDECDLGCCKRRAA